jgi:hypothetical protein
MTSPFINSILLQVEPLYQEIRSSLDSTPEDTIVSIPIDDQAGWYTELSPAVQSLLKTYGLFALRLQMKHEISLAHSGWLFNAFLEKLKDVGETLVSGNSQETQVGLMLNGRFEVFEQFSLAKQTPQHITYFAAVGPHARDCLQGILNAEAIFDPGKFDSDGYTIA